MWMSSESTIIPVVGFGMGNLAAQETLDLTMLHPQGLGRTIKATRAQRYCECTRGQGISSQKGPALSYIYIRVEAYMYRVHIQGYYRPLCE